MLGARNPDLLPANDVLVAFAGGHRPHLRRVRARNRLADAERLQAQLAARDLRQERALLRVGSVTQQRAHRVHLRVARASIRTAAIDLLEDDRRLGDAEAGAAVLFRNERRKVTGVCQRPHELSRIGPLLVELLPVTIRKRFAEIPDATPQVLSLPRDYH